MPTASSNSRSIWKGAISFGLVYVPVSLHSATDEQEVDFDWLDKRSMDPVGYKRINKRTGKEIDKDNIVKGVKLESDEYVVLSDEEIKAAYPKRTQTINIETFVKATDVSFVYAERPYYLVPEGKADRVYALLREALSEAGVIGIARFVLHNKEHLAHSFRPGPR
jgi:DNA end-binding protein Ku